MPASNPSAAEGLTSVVDAVRSQYGAVAESGLTNDHAGVRAVAEAFGYTAGELTSIPAEANMGLSCGNPTAAASLRPGEVVVDLGCGGGLDVFLAARRVGPTGKAIGIDMTPAMIDRARAAAAKGVGGRPIENVEFHLATIDRLPLADASVDCVISNCVINLAADKRAVFREIARVLKPGGRLAVSDIALRKPLPADLARDIDAYVGCVAGAIPVAEFDAGLRAAGFADVSVVDSGADLNAYAMVEGQAGCCSPAMGAATTSAGPATPERGTGARHPPRAAPAPVSLGSRTAVPLKVAGGGCCSPSESAPSADTSGSADTTVHGGLADLLARYDVNEYAASVKVYAVKPG